MHLENYQAGPVAHSRKFLGSRSSSSTCLSRAASSGSRPARLACMMEQCTAKMRRHRHPAQHGLRVHLLLAWILLASVAGNAVCSRIASHVASIASCGMAWESIRRWASGFCAQQRIVVLMSARCTALAYCVLSARCTKPIYCTHGHTSYINSSTTTSKQGFMSESLLIHIALTFLKSSEQG